MPLHPIKLDLGVVKILAEIDSSYLPPCPEPPTNENAEPIFYDDQETKQMVQFNVDAEVPYDDGVGTNPRIQIYKNSSNSKVAAKGSPTYVGFDISQANTIGYGLTSGGTAIKILENGEDKTTEWGTGSKEFTGVIPNIKFIYV